MAQSVAEIAEESFPNRWMIMGVFLLQLPLLDEDTCQSDKVVVRKTLTPMDLSL